MSFYFVITKKKICNNNNKKEENAEILRLANNHNTAQVPSYCKVQKPKRRKRIQRKKEKGFGTSEV